MINKTSTFTLFTLLLSITSQAKTKNEVSALRKFVPMSFVKINTGNPKTDFEIQATEFTQYHSVRVIGWNYSKLKNRSNCPEEFLTLNNIQTKGRIERDLKFYRKNTIVSVNLCPNFPVESVMLDDAVDIAKILNNSQKKYLYRLPTSSEWKLALNSPISGIYGMKDGVDEYTLECRTWSMEHRCLGYIEKNRRIQGPLGDRSIDKHRSIDQGFRLVRTLR